MQRHWKRGLGPTTIIAVAACLLGCGHAAAPSTAGADAVATDIGKADFAATSTPSACPKPAAALALSVCSTPTHPAAYYVAQANKYFDALDTKAPDDSVPSYSELVARWEWPPWLKLTGYTRDQMTVTDKLVKLGAPAVVSHRDCRFFAVQPFARCRVSFDYLDKGGKGCPIYEEFTFNDLGEMTFVEAWSDQPALLPFAATADAWGEAPDVLRLSTRVPGLGTGSGKIELDGAAMQAAASQDPLVADFRARAADFWTAFNEAAADAGDYFKTGCGW